MVKGPRKKEQYLVLYERIDSKVQQVLEGHSTLNQKIDALRQEVSGMKGELGDVGKAVMEVRGIVTSSNKRLEAFITRFEAHEHAHTS